MIFDQLKINGAYVISPEPISDARGHFARLWCQDEFRAQGVRTDFVQMNASLSHGAGTLRGLHYQAVPHSEAKLVRCTRGVIFDVAVDLRADSETFGEWFGRELSQKKGDMLYVPEGCAHGYLTLTRGAEVSYMVTVPYAPHAERGIRHDDPMFDIEWPIEVRHISEKDRSWVDFNLDKAE